MNARLKKIRNYYSREQISGNNVPENRYNTNKRKREEDDSALPSKKPFVVTDPPRLQPYRREEANVHSRGRQDIEQSKEQLTEQSRVQPKGSPKRYSANSRLKRIRNSIEEQRRKSMEVQSASPSFSSDPSSTTPTKTTLLYNKRNTSCVVTARPSSLEERISKIRNSTASDKLNAQNYERQTSTAVDTTGGGWFKSVDVEGKSIRNRHDETATCIPAAPSNLNMHTSFATDDRAAIQGRTVTSANHEFPIMPNNDLINQNTDVLMTSGVLNLNNNIVHNNIATLTHLDVDVSTACTGSSPMPNKSNSITNDDDVMDWSFFEEKEVLSNLKDLRKNFKIGSATPQTIFQQTVARESPDIKSNKIMSRVNYIVVDTNIFISHLDTVKKAMELQINGVDRPTILVPWIVIQELDHIKDGRSENKLKSKAQQAVHFINESLCNNANLKGQSVRDAAQQDFASSNFDDGILHCCLQIRDRGNRAVLLSNDVNLRNKLINENFEAYSHDQIFNKLDPYYIAFPKTAPSLVEDAEETSKIKDIQIRLSHMCTFIIMKELKGAYGELWNKMGSTKKKVPWSLQECLDLFEKYWISVFQMNLHKQSLKLIETFNRSLQSRNGTVKNAEDLVNYGFALCNYLKMGYPSYHFIIADCSDSIRDIYDSN